MKNKNKGKGASNKKKTTVIKQSNLVVKNDINNKNNNAEMLNPDDNKKRLKKFNENGNKTSGKKRKVIIVSFSIVAGVLALLLLFVMIAGGLFAPKEYLRAWQKDEYKNYSDIRMQVLSHAVLSPNAHNLQCWEVELDKSNDKLFNVYINTGKLTPISDPKFKEEFQTIGAFLEYVDIASKYLGYRAEINYFPKGEFNEDIILTEMVNKPVASIELIESEKLVLSTYKNLFRPTTSRGKYKKEILDNTSREMLKELNNNSNLSLKFISDKTDVKRISDLTYEATKQELSNKALVALQMQALRSNEYDKNKFKYGYSLSAQGFKGVFELLGQGLITIFPQIITPEATVNQTLDLMKKNLKTANTFMLIVSDNDDRISEIESGRLYARICLNGIDNNIGVQPLSRLVQDMKEISVLKEQFTEEFVPEGKELQFLTRVGKVNKLSDSKSMRQRADEVLKPY